MRHTRAPPSRPQSCAPGIANGQALLVLAGALYVLQFAIHSDRDTHQYWLATDRAILDEFMLARLGI
jgi:hypothetical protein